MFWRQNQKTATRKLVSVSRPFTSPFLYSGRKVPINERLLRKENVQEIFFLCVAAFRNISIFFNKRAAASEKISMND